MFRNPTPFDPSVIVNNELDILYCWECDQPAGYIGDEEIDNPEYMEYYCDDCYTRMQKDKDHV